LKKHAILKFFIILLIPLFMTAVFVVVVDPFFHYHAPIKGIPYTLSEERYQNDGIVKHFSYEALITGSSLTQNFKASDVERLWGKTAVKVCFAGASYKETAMLIDTALKHNKNLRLVIRGLDISRLSDEKDTMAYDEIPWYMYDDNPFNDYDYLFNADVILQSVRNIYRIFKKEKPTSFDEYSNWMSTMTFGREAVISTFTRIPEGEYVGTPFGEDDKITVKNNLEQNVLSLARNNPDVEFYVFLPPVSVCYWDAMKRTNSFEYVLDEIKYAYELLFEYDNIKVFGFDDWIEITGNLDYYMDSNHYSEDINTMMLECMARGEKLLTKDNYLAYLERVKENYDNYDYDSIFE